MNTTKTLMLAAVSALSIGVGVAMAQSEVPSAPPALYLQHNTIQAPVQPSQVQAGDDDVRMSALPVVDFSTIANPG